VPTVLIVKLFWIDTTTVVDHVPVPVKLSAVVPNNVNVNVLFKVKFPVMFMELPFNVINPLLFVPQFTIKLVIVKMLGIVTVNVALGIEFKVTFNAPDGFNTPTPLKLKVKLPPLETNDSVPVVFRFDDNDITVDVLTFIVTLFHVTPPVFKVVVLRIVKVLEVVVTVPEV
jgi:hypothetical protein